MLIDPLSSTISQMISTASAASSTSGQLAQQTFQQMEVKQAKEQDLKTIDITSWAQLYNRFIKQWGVSLVDYIFANLKDKDGNKFPDINIADYKLSLEIKSGFLFFIFKDSNSNTIEVPLKIQVALAFFDNLKEVKANLEKLKEAILNNPIGYKFETRQYFKYEPKTGKILFIEEDKINEKIEKYAKLQNAQTKVTVQQQTLFDWFKYHPQFSQLYDPKIDTWKRDPKQLEQTRAEIEKLQRLRPDCHVDYDFSKDQLYITEQNWGKIVYDYTLAIPVSKSVADLINKEAVKKTQQPSEQEQKMSDDTSSWGELLKFFKSHANLFYGYKALDDVIIPEMRGVIDVSVQIESDQCVYTVYSMLDKIIGMLPGKTIKSFKLPLKHASLHFKKLKGIKASLEKLRTHYKLQTKSENISYNFEKNVYEVRIPGETVFTLDEEQLQKIN